MGISAAPVSPRRRTSLRALNVAAAAPMASTVLQLVALSASFAAAGASQRKASDLSLASVSAATGEHLRVLDAQLGALDAQLEGNQDSALAQTKPLAKAINIKRAKSCWQNEKMWEQRACVQFLGVTCSRSSTGKGVCTQFLQAAGQRCQSHQGGKMEEYCSLFSKLNLLSIDAKASKTEKAELLQEDTSKASLPPWGDLDSDGKEDSVDKDIDGDGHPNNKDSFPMSSRDWRDLDKDGVGDNADWDKDGDGFGKQTDPYPENKYLPGDVDKDGMPDDLDPEIINDGHREPCAPHKDDVARKMNKVERALPPDGYDEHSPGLVEHDDMETATADWGREWPMHGETREDTMKRYCAGKRRNDWCKRMGYATA